MGHSLSAPGFGHVDLDLDGVDEVDDIDDIAAARETMRPPSFEAFGELDFDIPASEEHRLPATSRVFEGPKAGPITRTTREMVSVHDDSTRIVHGDPLSNITRPAREEAPASRTNGASSGSGVATRDGRVAAMRDLYAQGDAAGALALGGALGQNIAPGNSGDHRDASIVVEFGAEEEISEISDPLDHLASPANPASAPTAAPPRLAALPPPNPPVRRAAPQLLLSELHSIPRVLKSAGEVSKLPIDHRAGFLLAHVDGVQTLEEILDVCAMPPTEALDLIGKLKKMGVIEFE